ncbi:MAG: V-type ATPase subunit [Candidatus Hydrogenedentes bacterium]|nr:V-type ATPase subunit [Candidatus Hydrogenedentota bacterium]
MPDTDPFIIHFNARIHGMKSSLFSAGALEEFLTQGDLARLSDALLESPYRTELAEALTRFSGADAIEEAVSRNLVETFRTLIRRAQGDRKPLVAMFLTRWDLAAVKSLLRCQAHGVTGDEGLAWVLPGPTLSMPLLQDFLQYDSMESLVQALTAWNSSLCRCLVRALPAYQEGNDLAVLEEALDRTYFVTSVRALRSREDVDSSRLLGHFRAEIDRINLRLIFTALESGSATALEGRLLTDGFLPQALLQQMIGTGDSTGAMELLAGKRYGTLAEDLYQLLQTRRFSSMERFFERMLMHQMRLEAHRYVFGLGVMMDYVWLKYNEVINLRLIARGLAGQLPAGRVRDEMYFVA